MRRNKLKKILIIIFSILIIVCLSIFIYLYVYAANHNLFCSRMNGIVYEAYTFEFNTFKQIKDVSMQVINEYNVEENAINAYQEGIKNGEDVELDNKKVVYNFKEIPVEFPKKLKEAKIMCENWLYTCEMVKK